MAKHENERFTDLNGKRCYVANQTYQMVAQLACAAAFDFGTQEVTRPWNKDAYNQTWQAANALIISFWASVEGYNGF